MSAWRRHYGIPNVYGSHFRRVALDSGQHSRRPARPGKHSDRDFLWQPDVARSARQMDSGKYSRDAAAAAAAKRSAAEGQSDRSARF